jgi:hypothetical protein
MAAQMRFGLAFGFGEKPQVPAAVETAGKHADRQRAAIPQRVEDALASAQFVDALRRPGQIRADAPS